MEEKKQRGGARPGAGRKAPATKRRVKFSIDIHLADKLKQEPNQSVVVEGLLREHYERESKK